uniref:Candidate secreted effector n=1 Tax=Meloidogyne incognita TaxID=6306 RepID=A0A914KUL9_MELIC
MDINGMILNREKREQQLENLDSTSEPQGTTKAGCNYDDLGIIICDENDSTSSSPRDPPPPPPTLKAQDPSTEEPKTSTLMPTTNLPTTTTPVPTTTTPKPTTHKPTKAHKTTKKAEKFFINLDQLPQGKGGGKIKAVGRMLIPQDNGSA